MPDPRLPKLLRDLKNGRDVSRDLKGFWSPLAEKPLSNNESLALAQAVAKTAEALQSRASLQAWYEAIKEFRRLAVFLKTSNSSDPLESVASIEKYSLNYALRACQGEIDDPSLVPTASAVAAETLRLIFDCRNTPEETPKSKKTPKKTPRSKTPRSRLSRKENFPPGGSSATSAKANGHREDLIFAEMSGVDASRFQPGSENAMVSSVVAGAITIRVAAKCDDMPLLSRLELAQKLGVSWTRHLSQCRGDTAALERRSDALLMKMKNGLLIAAKGGKSSPSDVLRARAFAVTLSNPSVQEYTYNALRVVNSFLRRPSIEADSQKDDYEQVAVVYKDVVAFLLNMEIDPETWAIEDVSSLLDHIIATAAKCESLGISRAKSIPRTAISSLLQRRCDALSSAKKVSCEFYVHSFQKRLFDQNVYKLFAENSPASWGQKKTTGLNAMTSAMNETLVILVPVDKKFRKGPAKGSSANTLLSQKAALRLLRILEPYRRDIVHEISSLTPDVTSVLQLYLSVLTASLAKKAVGNGGSAKKERLSEGEVTARLGKMFGAGIEAAEKLISFYIWNGDSEGMDAALQYVTSVFGDKTRRGSSWTAWIARKVYETCARAYTLSREEKSKIELDVVAKALLAGTRWLAVDEGGDSRKGDKHFPDIANMLCLTIDCYIASGDVVEALYIAARKLLRSFCFDTSWLSNDILPPRVRARLLWACGKAARLALQNDCIDEFLEEFSPDEDISESLARRIGYHFFHALGEHSFAIRREEKSSYSTSVALRDIVKAQNVILHTLNLPGKCIALRIYQEWTSLLLDGISFGITNSPRLLSETGTVSLSNGQKIEVELGPRFCKCTICSGESFILLHILKGAWRAALHRSPALLKPELEKLELFLTVSDMRNIHLNITILSLDFLEWCQAFALLSSIEDPKCIISKCIHMLKDELGMDAAPQDVVQIYAAHGFLAGRPYYSHLLHSGRHIDAAGEGKDGRWSLIEEEKFMLEGSRADFFVQNLNLKSAVSTARKSLKALLVKIMGFKYGVDKPVFTVGGAEFEVQTDILTATDRARALQIVELIFAMERLGSINMKLENFNDGVYFLEKAAILSKTLCGMNSVLHRRQKSVLYQGQLLTLRAKEDVNDYLASELQEVALQTGINFDKTLVSNSYSVAADIAISAADCNGASEATKNFGDIAEKLSSSALDVIGEDESCKGEEASDDALINTLISQDVTLRCGQAHLLLGNFEKAATLFDEIRQTVHENRLDVYLISVLGLIRALVGKLGGVEETKKLLNAKPGKTPRAKTPRFRRASRKSPGADKITDVKTVVELLKEATQCLDGSSCEPHIRTEVFLVHSSILGPGQSGSGLVWEIGNGFGLQWDIRREGREQPVIELDPEDDLAERVKNLRVSSQKEQDLEQCQTLLYDSNIVVVGMSLDEAKNGIFLWRISAAGFFSTRLEIPADGETSYDSITKRMKEIFEKMKGNAVKPGDSFTEDQKESWWDTTFDLDTAMKVILEDIERDWFGPCGVFLLPACSSPSDEIPGDETSQVMSALLCAEECFEEAVPRTKAKEAFEFLGFKKSAFQKAAQYISALDCEEAQVGSTVFVLDSRLEQFPFESLPILRSNNAASTRVPSLQYLIAQLSAVQKRPSPSNVFYLLNPGGDLPRTEKKFRTVFEKRKGWSGVAGVSTGTPDFSEEVNDAEIFVYIGHGGGEKYIAPRQLDNKENAPVAVLMGCSSVKLSRRSGYRGSSGTPLDYLLQGAPAVVGNLWDVTDKDIDRLTAAFLKEWLGVSSGQRRTLSIAESLAVARNACRLPHLVGAATVIYGLPSV